MKSIIDSSKPAFEQDLPQVDAILDTVGGSTFQRCVAALKPGGKLVTVGLHAAAASRGHFLLR